MRPHYFRKVSIVNHLTPIIQLHSNTSAYKYIFVQSFTNAQIHEVVKLDQLTSLFGLCLLFLLYSPCGFLLCSFLLQITVNTYMKSLSAGFIHEQIFTSHSLKYVFSLSGLEQIVSIGQVSRTSQTSVPTYFRSTRVTGFHLSAVAPPTRIF